MILTGKEIESRIGKDIIISDFDKSRLNPNSYNLRLGHKFLIYNSDRKSTIFEDSHPEGEFYTETIGRPIVFKPGELILAETMEYTETHNLVPLLEGRSSIARQFCLVHISAGFGDIGFKGKWTLEIVPLTPVTLWPGMEICQIYYHTILGEAEEYSGRYNENNGVQAVINGGI